MLVLYRQNGGLAEKPEYVEGLPEKIYKKAATKKFTYTKKQKKRITYKVLLISIVAFIALTRFAAVSTANLNMLSVQKEIEKQQTINSGIEYQLSQASYLTNIQQKAKELNMDFPNQDQVVYVDVKPFSTITEEAKAQQPKQENNFLFGLMD